MEHCVGDSSIAWECFCSFVQCKNVTTNEEDEDTNTEAADQHVVADDATLATAWSLTDTYLQPTVQVVAYYIFNLVLV